MNAASRPIRSDMWVATKRIPPRPANESNPSKAGWVPATNMTTKVVAPIKAVVPRSTSMTIRMSAALIIANGMTNPCTSRLLSFSRVPNHAARKKRMATFAISEG